MLFPFSPSPRPLSLKRRGGMKVQKREPIKALWLEIGKGFLDRDRHWIS
jgi:hypothetical protein